MSVCVECGKPAEYDVPKLLCGEHWAEWVAHYGGGGMTADERTQLYHNVMEVVTATRTQEGAS